jgi:hypothetical protein
VTFPTLPGAPGDAGKKSREFTEPGAVVVIANLQELLWDVVGDLSGVDGPRFYIPVGNPRLTGCRRKPW